MNDREKFAHWLEGFAKADAMDGRAATFLLNNFQRVINALTAAKDEHAADRFHELRTDFFDGEPSGW